MSRWPERAIVALLLLQGCVGSAPTSEGVRQPEAPRDLCVVLSVGAEKGLAHIGVLTALREEGVPVSCVVGNSMGALVGGLYAAQPEADVAPQMQQLFRAYEDKTRRDAGPLGVGTLFGVQVQDWHRLREVLRAHLGGERIESLELGFVTEHQVVTRSGVRMESVRGGVLADEVAKSIANPILFSDIRFDWGTPIDPGADRASAVPLRAACEAFPHAQFLVSNVTESPTWSEGVSCPYQEVVPASVEVDPARALRALDPELRKLIASGFAAAREQIDWSALPRTALRTQGSAPGTPAVQPRGTQHGPALAPFPPPLEFVELGVELSLAPAQPDGKGWDGLLGGKPDPWLRTTIRACEGCDAYGTSAGASFSTQGSATFSLRQELGVVALRRGFVLEFTVTEKDVTGEDPLGAARFIYEGLGATPLENDSQLTEGVAIRVTVE